MDAPTTPTSVLTTQKRHDLLCTLMWADVATPDEIPAVNKLTALYQMTEDERAYLSAKVIVYRQLKWVGLDAGDMAMSVGPVPTSFAGLDEWAIFSGLD